MCEYLEYEILNLLLHTKSTHYTVFDIIIVHHCYAMQVYELSSGSLLCSILFDFGLTSVTMDANEYFLFVGGFNGTISQVNLYTHVSAW